MMEMGWVRLRGRRRAPGRPVTYGTTEEFLEHFGFDNVKDLPGLAELKGAGLLDSNLPPGFSIPEPNDSPLLTPTRSRSTEDDAEEVEERSEAEQPLSEEDAGRRGPREFVAVSSQVFDLLRRGQA